MLLAYLDHFRSVLADKLRALPAEAVRSSLVSSGWTPIELAVHLTFVERRWLVWGFEGQDVGDPWGDEQDDRWHADPDLSLDDVLSALSAQGQVTSDVVRRHELTEVGLPGPRWDGALPATLERVLLHLVQEHARHLGHLDIVCELSGER